MASKKSPFDYGYLPKSHLKQKYSEPVPEKPEAVNASDSTNSIPTFSQILSAHLSEDWTVEIYKDAMQTTRDLSVCNITFTAKRAFKYDGTPVSLDVIADLLAPFKTTVLYSKMQEEFDEQLKIANDESARLRAKIADLEQYKTYYFLERALRHQKAGEW